MQLWRQLDLDALWSPRLPASREGTPWLKVLKTLVAYRLIDPGSEWRLHRQWFDASAMADLLDADFALAEKNTLYLLRTNLGAGAPEQLWSFYIQLTEVEQAFKELKHDLALRPIHHHQLEHRIEAHIFVAFMFSRSTLDFFEQAGAGVFDQIERVLESGGAAAVGVGHPGHAGAGAKVGKAAQFVLLRGRAQGAGGALVVPVHDEHEVELGKIAHPQRPGTLTAQIVAAARGMGLRPRVGRRSGMTVICAGGVHQHAGGQTRVGRHFFEHALRRRAAADVTHANHEHPQRKAQGRLWRAAGVLFFHGHERRRPTFPWT